MSLLRVPGSLALVAAMAIACHPSPGGVGSACKAAGGTCTSLLAPCVKSAPDSAQDCTPSGPPSPGGGANCCLEIANGSLCAAAGGTCISTYGAGSCETAAPGSTTAPSGAQDCAVGDPNESACCFHVGIAGTACTAAGGSCTQRGTIGCAAVAPGLAPCAEAPASAQDCDLPNWKDEDCCLQGAANDAGEAEAFVRCASPLSAVCDPDASLASELYNGCPPLLATSLPSPWCASNPSAYAVYGSCGGYAVLEAQGSAANVVTLFMYPADGGDLAAVIVAPDRNVQGCIGGTPDFAIPTGCFCGGGVSLDIAFNGPGALPGCLNYEAGAHQRGDGVDAAEGD